MRVVKTRLDAEANSNVHNIFVGIFQRGGCTISKSRSTHKRAAAPQHATDHGDLGARGSSGSCSANGPGGCRIFANYFCSVRVCARGQICASGLTSRQHLEINTLPRSQPESETRYFSRFCLEVRAQIRPRAHTHRTA